MSTPIKAFLHPPNVLSSLSYKASLQKIRLSTTDIDSILKSLAKHPFILSATFHKILTNALCTTSRIKNHPTLACFACGKSRDDLYHFLRCPHVAFIFKLPPAFGSLHKSYFSPNTLAKLAVFFETYYIVTKQYGPTFFKSNFEFVATKTAGIARQVAIKNKLLYLSQLPHISDNAVSEFVYTQQHPAYTCNVLDAALM